MEKASLSKYNIDKSVKKEEMLVYGFEEIAKSPGIIPSRSLLELE